MLALKNSILKGVNISAFEITVVVNAYAGMGLINGVSTGALSNMFDTLVTPAGFAFSIWTIIYILLGVYVVFQALPSQKGKNFQSQIGPLFALSSIFNVFWIILWQSKLITLSLFPMFLLLLSLIAIYLRLDVGRSNVSGKEKLAVHLPFSVYLGWITIAAVTNVSAALVSIHWNGFGVSPIDWATIVLGMVLTITLIAVIQRKDVGFGLVVIWALVGIATKRNENSMTVSTAILGIAVTTAALAAVILVARFKNEHRFNPI